MSLVNSEGITSILASSPSFPWILTRYCLKPSSRRSSSAFSTLRSFSSLTISPYTNLVARQAKEGLFQVGSPSPCEISLICAFVSPASRRGLMTPSSAMARSPGL